MRLSNFLPVFLVASTATALVTPAVENRDVSSIFSTLQSDVFAHTAALNATTDAASAQSEVKALTTSLRSAVASYRALPTAGKKTEAKAAQGVASDVLSELIPTMRGLSSKPELAGLGWTPVLMDFNSGVSSFATEIPVFDSGILGLVTLLLNLVLGTVGGLLPF